MALFIIIIIIILVLSRSKLLFNIGRQRLSRTELKVSLPVWTTPNTMFGMSPCHARPCLTNLEFGRVYINVIIHVLVLLGHFQLTQGRKPCV